jgi:hypothetical protein
MWRPTFGRNLSDNLLDTRQSVLCLRGSSVGARLGAGLAGASGRRRRSSIATHSDTTVTVYSMAPFGRCHSTSSTLTPRPLAQAISRAFDAAQKPRIVFELIIEPIILGYEADQQFGRVSAAGDHDLVTHGFAQKPG